MRSLPVKKTILISMLGICVAWAAQMTNAPSERFTSDSAPAKTGEATASRSTTSLDTPPDSKPGFVDFIIQFREDTQNPGAEGREIARQHGAELGFVYQHAIKGVSIRVPEHAVNGFLQGMGNNPQVDVVEPDIEVRAVATTNLWNLDRIDQRSPAGDNSYTPLNNGAGTRAYVVDTGVMSTHEALAGRIASGYTTMADGSTEDCHGHGTHVAGTLAGVKYGVAYGNASDPDTSSNGATIVPVRVLNCMGVGSNSSVIAGVDWIIANHPNGSRGVINMSLGAKASSTMDAAVANAVKADIPVIVAAGNSNKDACTQSPAREPSAITVGASDNTDTRASFSNYGKCLDLFAPGVGILSAWTGSNSAEMTLQGTSMAAPHAAGVVAQLLVANPDETAFTVGERLKAMATQGAVKSLGTGSPNLLLFTGAVAPSEPIVVDLTLSNITITKTRKSSKATLTATVKSGEDTAGNVNVAGIFTTTEQTQTADCTTDANGTCILSANLSASGCVTFKATQVTGLNITWSGTGNTSSSCP